MTTEFQSRLDDIRSGPWREQSSLARQRLPGLSPHEAHRHLRSHFESANGISDPAEIEFRESFDQLLEELQLLELAVACGYLPLEVVRPVASREIETLLLPQVAARAYLKTYDFVLVRFLAARLGIDLRLDPVTPPPINSKAAIRFAAFLAAHAEFNASPQVELFTRLLDDYRFEGLVDAAYLKAYLAGGSDPSDAAQRERLADAGQGLVLFVQILGDFFVNVDSAEQPLFGCAHAYWLGHFFGVRRLESGFVNVGESFADVVPRAVLFPRDLDPQSLASEQRRLQNGIATLRSVWSGTRALLESLDR
jgi:hypothetical protein